MTRRCGIFAFSSWPAVALVLTLGGTQAVAQRELLHDFVHLRDIDPTILQDIRYAGADNFVGRPLAGYEAAECILKRDVAMALRRVQADLKASGLSLKVYDCYRPTRAVRAMAQWARDGVGGGATKRFFPRLDKGQLFGLGYLSARSAHSTGTAVDLTLVELPRPPQAAFNPETRYGPCNGTAAARAPDDSVDMGTGYDCFDVDSHTRSAAVGAEQRHRRTVLVAAMARRGFANYHKEWWHFSYGHADAVYDFPIRAR